MRPHRICHVQVLPLMSGVQRSMLEIFKHLDRNVFEPFVVCQCEGELTDELRRLQIPYLCVPQLQRSIHPLRDVQAYRELKRLFQERQFDLVHTHSSKPGIVARIAARKAGVRAVVHHVRGFAFHEFSPRYQRLVYGSLERWAGRYGDRTVFVNHEERELAIARGILPREKCVTIYNGVDFRHFTDARHDEERAAFRALHGLAADDVAIAVVGRIDKQKQSLILPEIASELSKLCLNRRWTLFVAGGGPLEGALREQVAGMKLGGRVQVLGWQSDPHGIYHGTDIKLLPSLWEGLPRSLIEAQAAGLPIVASNVKGNREVVTGATGFLCSPKVACEYAEALARLVEDQALRKRMARAAKARAVEHFDSRANSRQLVALYEQLLGEAPAVMATARAA